MSPLSLAAAAALTLLAPLWAYGNPAATEIAGLIEKAEVAGNPEALQAEILAACQRVDCNDPAVQDIIQAELRESEMQTLARQKQVGSMRTGAGERTSTRALQTQEAASEAWTEQQVARQKAGAEPIELPPVEAKQTSELTQKIAAEVVSTEKTYIDSLGKILPETAGDSSLMKLIETSKVNLTPHETELLGRHFGKGGSLEQIAKAGRKIVSEDEVTAMSQAQEALIATRDSYIAYNRDYQELNKIFSEKLQTNEKFSNAWKNFHSTTLQGITIQPAQRVPRYKLLAEEMIKKSKNEGISSQAKELRQISHATGTEINEAIRTREALEAMTTKKPGYYRRQSSVSGPEDQEMFAGLAEVQKLKGKLANARPGEKNAIQDKLNDELNAIENKYQPELARAQTAKDTVRDPVKLQKFLEESNYAQFDEPTVRLFQNKAGFFYEPDLKEIQEEIRLKKYFSSAERLSHLRNKLSGKTPKQLSSPSNDVKDTLEAIHREESRLKGALETARGQLKSFREKPLTDTEKKQAEKVESLLNFLDPAHEKFNDPNFAPPVKKVKLQRKPKRHNSR